jgi:hypothetical protein
MANAVFDYTQDALATMVSPRAAKRVLEDALVSANETPDTVSVSVMQDLLTGHIRFELEQMLPREGLQGRLEQLSARLAKLQVPADELATEDAEMLKAETAGTESVASLDTANTANTADITTDATTSAIAESAIADLAEFTRKASAAKHVPTDIKDAAKNAAKDASSKPVKGKLSAPMWKDQFAVANKAARLKGITMADSTETKKVLSEAQLEKIVMRFAQVEHAKLIAAVRENGTIVTSRGAGVDLNSLSRFGLMGLRLLERSGELRSYYLAHSQGQLFLFRFGRDTVIMLGSSDINVGTVFATLSSVKDSL